MRIRLELLDVLCRKNLGTEDVTGNDEFYIAGTIISDTNGNKGVLTTPLNINNSQTKGFAEPTMYDGNDPDNAMLAVHLRAYDEDVAHDWANRPEVVDKIATGVASAAGGAIVAGLATAAIGWPVIAAGVGTGLALGGFYLAMGSDKDDQLGLFQELIPVSGPAVEERYWNMKQDGWYSSWDYQVHLRIRRG
jgi:hypothetical protein